MIKQRSIFVLFMLVCLLYIPNQSFGQYRVKWKAKKHLENGEYEEAKELLHNYDKTSYYKKLLYYRAIAHFETNNLNSSARDFIASYKLGNNDREVFWYLGKILQSQKKYVLAIAKYKAYLRSNPPDVLRENTIRHIRECTRGMELRIEDANGYVSSINPLVNTRSNEFGPVYSVNNRGVFYFNSQNISNKISIYKGHREYEPILLIGDEEGSYKLECFDAHGTKMIYQKINDLSRNHVIQEFDTSGLSTPYYFNSPVNVEEGDKDLILFKDKIILFSSNRVGGYGGFDIYVSYMNDGQWIDPINLGPSINTTANEISPFLCTDGQKLYFSSDRVRGLGGHDIYSSIFNTESMTWDQANNLNTPINSSEDDIQLSLSGDGTIGIFSSDRKTSEGGFDIYKVKLAQIEVAQHIKKEHYFTYYLN